MGVRVGSMCKWYVSACASGSHTRICHPMLGTSCTCCEESVPAPDIATFILKESF